MSGDSFFANPISYICLAMLGMCRMNVLWGTRTFCTCAFSDFPERDRRYSRATGDHLLSVGTGNTLARTQNSTSGGRRKISFLPHARLLVVVQEVIPLSMRNTLYFEAFLEIMRAKRTLKAVTMRGIFASCAIAALLLAVTWADLHQHQHQHHHHHHHHHHPGHSPAGELTCSKLSAPNADFGFALYKSLNARAAAGKNIFYSPLGISTALSMLSTGARGETLKQLFSSLGYSAHDQAKINEAYHHLFDMLGQSQQDQQLDVGSAVAVRSGFSPLEKFLTDVKYYYGGESFNVDFTKPVEAAAEINRFIASKTQDKIKDMVKDLNNEMAMVLINYVFFRGQWEKPFDASLTHKADFNVDETTKVQVDMMKRMNEVEGYINKDYVRSWHDMLFRNSVDLFMPKFSISADASLDDTLKELGVADAFTNNADFSGMSEEVKLKVSKVSHQAVLTVDETGTEAAATTTLEVMPMSMPEIMVLNRPFLVFILEHSTKSILFMGKINNPAAM
uniref:Serpin peptidase inhibitor, clade A (alpha-1 antiproteinase, antitrypsin), member 1 n=1 Tax=Scophthalmus maximus TaxID=52904 RepID=A0A8D2ZT55_SCOMX